MLNRTSYTLTQLEYVLAVYKHGHFAKAAQACGVTQPTLSMQIQKLEGDLGITIFDRSKKPILLTEIGKKIIEQIQAILVEAGKINGIIEIEKSGKLKGQLTVGVIPTVAPDLLPLLLPELETVYPDIALKIHEHQTHRIIDLLNNDELDVGILAIPLKIPKIFELALYVEPFSVLCKKGHELTHHKKVHADLLKYDDIWLLEEGHCLRSQVLDVCTIKKGKSIHHRFSFESGSLETLKNLINNYGGYTLLPALSTGSIGSKTQVIPFERPIPARQIGLVYRREHHKNQLIEALADAILKGIPEEIRKIRQKDLDIIPID